MNEIEAPRIAAGGRQPRDLSRLLIVYCVAAVGCVDGIEPDLAVQETDSAGITVVTIRGTLATLPEWTVVTTPTLEISGDAEPFLGSVGSVALLSDGRAVVEDNQTDELRLFDTGGDSYRLIGGKGDGPGEFQNVRAVSVAQGDTIAVFDSRHNRLSTFDRDGGFVRSLQLEREIAGAGSLLYNGWVLHSEEVVLHSVGPSLLDGVSTVPRRDQRSALIYHLDGTGAIEATAEFRGGYSVRGETFDAGSPLANQPLVAVGAGRVLWGSGIDYELTVQGSGTMTERIVRWPEWDRVPIDSVLGSVRDTVEAGLSELRAARPEMAEALLNAMFHPDVLPDELPALGEVLVDDGGRIWVSRFSPTTDRWDQIDSWHVLDPSGVPIARVSLPDRAKLVAVRANTVALVMRDDLDVEHLRVFPIAENR